MFDIDLKFESENEINNFAKKEIIKRVQITYNNFFKSKFDYAIESIYNRKRFRFNFFFRVF